MKRIPILMLLLFLFSINAAAQTTQKRYLSGTGNDNTADWEFFCSEGRNSGRWTTIPVPSQWELQGFGAYNYGHDKPKAHEYGKYRNVFSVPAVW